ncbi:MAG: DUF1840 domain-containing protein [Comamonadaceae bacterium]|nr:DUF1840 domain-containing protein [Burkholderiales bacterium]MEB2347186.1 DUF1840 domain-containing protein [Comamonadaceae bacterium]
MLFKFKSRATADLIMLEPVGERVLKILGKEVAPHGIITVEQIPAAVAALRAAVAEEEAGEPPAPPADPAPQGAQREDDPSERVWLRQRVAPFIEMLETSAASGREVTW